MTDITPIDTARQKSKLATTPKESFANEAQWKAAEAWAKEQRDYEMVVNAFKGWILQRRNTTRLIEPHIVHGDHGLQSRGNDIDTSVVLADFGFTKLQWSRRKKELEISPIQVDGYLDECIEKSMQPTLYGMLGSFANGRSVAKRKITCPNCGHGWEV